MSFRYGGIRTHRPTHQWRKRTGITVPTLPLSVKLLGLSLVRERAGEQLDDWLDHAMGSGVSALKSFASGIRRDDAAVKASLSVPYRNGVVEGNGNRLN